MPGKRIERSHESGEEAANKKTKREYKEGATHSAKNGSLDVLRVGSQHSDTTVVSANHNILERQKPLEDVTNTLKTKQIDTTKGVRIISADKLIFRDINVKRDSSKIDGSNQFNETYDQRDPLKVSLLQELPMQGRDIIPRLKDRIQS